MGETTTATSATTGVTTSTTTTTSTTATGPHRGTRPGSKPKAHEQPKLTRRSLLRRGGMVGVTSAAATGMSGLLPLSTSRAAAASEIVHIDLVAGEDAGPPIREAAGQLPISNRVFRIHGSGRYPLTGELLFLGSQNVELIFDPEVTLFRPIPETRNAMIRFSDATDCVLRGGCLDANNSLVGLDDNGVAIGVGNAINFFGTRLTADGVTFKNTGGEVGRLDMEPPRAILIAGQQNRVVNCDITTFHRAIQVNGGSIDIEHNVFSDLLDNRGTADSPDAGAASGGGFVLVVDISNDVRIRHNRTRAGRPSYGVGEVGGSVVQFTPAGISIPPATTEAAPGDAKHTRAVVEDNYFYSPPGAFAGATGVAGDVIALKAVTEFAIRRNVVEGGGEFGIVASHASNNGVITHNVVSGTDGAAVVVGAENDLEATFRQVTRQVNPRVFDIEVVDNLISNPGLDANGRRRGDSRPERTTVGNYPNAISGIRIWNASRIVLQGNVVNQYRSSGIWIKDTFTGDSTELHAEFGVSEQDLNEVTDLTVASNNVLVPWADPGRSIVYNDANFLAGDDPAALEPWSGTSFIPNIDGTKSSAIIDSVDASRIISRDMRLEPIDYCVELPEVIVSSRCLSGRGRIDVRLENPLDFTAQYFVVLSGLSPRPMSLEAGEAGVVSITGRSDGIYNLVVTRGGTQIYNEELAIACS